MSWTDPDTGTTYCCSDRHAVVPRVIELAAGTTAWAGTFPLPAWLVEIERRGRVGYWTGRTMDGHGGEWTVDPTDAVAFASEEDARRIIERHPIQPARAVQRG